MADPFIRRCEDKLGENEALKMRVLSAGVLIAVLAAVFVWFFFPTSLGAQHETFKPLQASDFS